VPQATTRVTAGAADEQIIITEAHAPAICCVVGLQMRWVYKSRRARAVDAASPPRRCAASVDFRNYRRPPTYWVLTS